ncbi:oxygen-independent coproporphyrinogen III oxidase [Neobacillus notoginsengisoli]|uniref:Heme chaperone HemW n=1 Tax=Neobacillus notoginsengisoli TaxID=1578198 RepID=A0A417YUM7_9BACI|nr:radical SAM family heme chaperone HemW [Neobacillus notoginsengisoli]RHW41004.1 oxygen-independent coproporphyrinogen III oxidase [Neobacillus notoginsengisoli]
MNETSPQSAYIHIPFCHHICHYCDFNKFFLKGQPVDEYLDALDREMMLTFERVPAGEMRTIFVGGGTPTALSEGQLEKLGESIKNRFRFGNDVEFTFEGNPGDLSPEKLAVLKSLGVNRLSLGVQSFNDQLLERIGRSHRAKDVYETVENAKNAGFENISLDLIYALPGQTLHDFKETLKTALSLDLPHFSGYSLIVEPKTVFYNLMRKGQLPLPGEDTEAAMYEVLMDEMLKHGLHQYEISNFAKKGYESKHNLTYWKNDEYYGFGAGAHSYVAGIRKSNIGPLNKYLTKVSGGELPVLEENKVTREEAMEEEMFLGLRTNGGVRKDVFKRKFAVEMDQVFPSQIEKLSKNGLIEKSSDRICLTRKGRLLGNEVFQMFLLK